MELSIQKHLERQSTETLDMLLRSYYRDSITQYNANCMLAILDILWERESREDFVPPEITPEVQKAMAELLERYKNIGK